jgi:hypothetical protein
MKITNIRLRQLTGTMEVEGPFMEERLVMPLDRYEEFRVQGPPAAGKQVDDTLYQLNQVFVQIETDEGVTGISGPHHARRHSVPRVANAGLPDRP